MKKTVIKSVSLLLAIMLCLTLALPVAYAEGQENDEAVVIIEDLTDETEEPAEPVPVVEDEPAVEEPAADETDELIELDLIEDVEEEPVKAETPASVPAEEKKAVEKPAETPAVTDKTETPVVLTNNSKAKASIDVKSEVITYGQTPALVVNTDPADLDYVRVIAGTDGDAQNFVSIDFPASTKELMKIKVKGVTVFDGYSYLAAQIGDGVSVDEFRSIVDGMVASITANPAYYAAAVHQGLDLSAFFTVYGVLGQISSLDANAKVALGKAPKNAGVYLVTAISADLDYCPVSDTGYLTIMPKATSMHTLVELRFKADIPGMYNILSYEDAQTFDFGGKLYVNGKDKGSSHVNAIYVGTTFDGEFIPHRSEPIREPGVYTETIFVQGGNYYANPIVRTYTVDRRKIELVMENDSVTYDGEAHGLTATDKNGADIDGVTYYYVGFGYQSAEPPVNAGVYTVYANYPGDKMNKPAFAFATLTIHRAPATVVVSCVEEIPYGEIDAEHMDAAEIDLTAEGLFGDDRLGAFRYILVNDENFPNIGEYTVSAVPIFFTNPNYKITVVDATLRIVPRDVTITFDEIVKYYGDPDPELTVQISDLGYGEPLNYELVRDEGEDVGRYDIHCLLGENPNYNITLVNNANHEEGYVPVLSGKLEIAATGADEPAEEEEVTGDFYIIPRPVDVTVGSASKYEDEDDPEIPVDIIDDDGTAYDGDTVGLEIERVWDEELGGYWLIPSITNPNYELRNAQEGFLKILKRSAPVDDEKKEESKPAAPTTGDMSTLMIFLVTVVIALAAAVLLRFRKKSN